MTNKYLPFIGLMLLASCANKGTEPTNDSVTNDPVQPVCSAPPAPQNIWKLEPMLKEKGLITEDMTHSEKEQVIRDYINKKNATYINCVKGTKK